jgi:hypothetical protein
MSSTRIENQKLQVGMLVYHHLDGQIGKVERIYQPGEFADTNGRRIPQAVAIVDMLGLKEQYLLPPTGKQFSQLPDNVENCLATVRRIVDSTITDIVYRLQKDVQIDENTAMLVVGSVIRENMRYRGQKVD